MRTPRAAPTGRRSTGRRRTSSSSVPTTSTRPIDWPRAGDAAPTVERGRHGRPDAAATAARLPGSDHRGDRSRVDRARHSDVQTRRRCSACRPCRRPSPSPTRAAERDGARLIPFGHLAEGNRPPQLPRHDRHRPHRRDRARRRSPTSVGRSRPSTASASPRHRGSGLIRSSADLAAQRAIKLALDPNASSTPASSPAESTR